MATLHMDSETAHSIQELMDSDHKVMLNMLNMLTEQVNLKLKEAWIGPSSSEYQLAYAQLSTQINQQLDSLEKLTKKLKQEIQEWEDIGKCGRLQD